MVCVRQGQCGKEVSIGRSFIVQWLWGKVSETTSGEANFSSRFSRIILKNFPPKVSRRLERAFHVASREAALKGETARLWTGIKEYLDSRNFFEFVCAVKYDKRASFVASAKYIEILGKTHCLTCGILGFYKVIYFAQELFCVVCVSWGDIDFLP